MSIAIWASVGLVYSVALAENVIQQEEMSFDRCLKVISVSETKLSIAPEISELTDKKTSAIFTLVDGTLTITCDAEKGILTVSTKMN